MKPGPKALVQFEQFAADFHAGVAIGAIADALGISHWAVRGAIKRAGHSIRKGGDSRNVPAKQKADERFRLMRDAYQSGLTLEQIGQIHGVTRERTRQILAKGGVTSKDGGQHVTATIKRQRRQDRANLRVETRCMNRLKCTAGQVEAITGSKEIWTNRITHAYLDQARNAKAREIEFLLTFPEWWSVWQASGKWSERGRGAYVMARNGDIGPYAIGNVRICTQSENSKESFIKTPAHVRAAKAAMNPRSKKHASLGRGRGYTILKRCTTRPYQVMCGKDRVGYFATEEEARAAYLAACEAKRLAAAGVLEKEAA